MKLAAAFQGTFDAGKYASTIKTVDAAASKNKNALIIKGNGNANLCIGNGSIRLDDVSLTSTVHVIDASGKKKNYVVSSLKMK